MAELAGKTACITGASSGIGAACARALAGAGARLVLCARRRERLQEVAAGLGSEVQVLELDVRDRDAVERTLGRLEVDVLVNNAGLARGLVPIQEGSLDDWDEMLDTNVKGLLYVSKSLLPGLMRRRGHIVHIGSLAGREVYPRGNVYCASKHAVAALGEAMRLDLVGTGVRVSSIDPGMVGDTEFSAVRFHGDRARAIGVYRGLTPLSAADVAEAVLWVLARPAHVQVAEMLLLSTDQASSTLVHRADA